MEVQNGIPHVIPVRDSKCADGPVLTFGPDAFAAFVGGVRNGAV